MKRQNNVKWDDVEKWTKYMAYKKYNYLGPIYQPEDLVQEGWILFNNCIETYPNINKKALYSIYYKAFKNKCINKYKRKLFELQHFIGMSLIDEEDEAFLHEDNKDFYVLMNMVPLDIRNTITTCLNTDLQRTPISARRLSKISKQDSKIMERIKEYLA